MTEIPDNFIDADAEGLISEAEEILAPGNQIENLDPLPPTADNPDFGEPYQFKNPSTQNEPSEPDEEPLNSEFSLKDFVSTLPPDSGEVIVVVTRFPDRNAGIKFRAPCDRRRPIKAPDGGNYMIYGQSREEIEREVLSDWNGGYYQFQLMVNGRMTAHKWSQILYDTIDLSRAEKAELEMLKAKNPAPDEMRNENVSHVSRPAPPPAEQPKSRREMLREWREEMAEMQELFPDAPAPVPAEPRVSARERMAEMCLNVLEEQANNGDARAMNALVTIGMDALGVNKDTPEPPALTLGGAFADLIMNPKKLEEWGDTAEVLVSKFGPMIAANLPKQQQQPPAQNAAPRGVSRFRRAATAPEQPTAPASPNNSDAGSATPPPNLELVKTTPPTKLKLVKW